MTTLSPSGTPSGTRMLIWYRPANPGPNPEKKIWAATPPMVTWGVLVVK